MIRKSSSFRDLSTRPRREWNANGIREPASVQLGGIKVWAESESGLYRAISTGQSAIESIVKSYLGVSRATIKKQVQDQLDAEIEERVFSAVLGQTLRTGAIDSTVCASKNDRSFRVFMHSNGRARWNEALKLAFDEVSRRSILAVRDLEAKVFGKREYGTWSSASYLLARLNYLGIVRFLEDDKCALVRFR